MNQSFENILQQNYGINLNTTPKLGRTGIKILLQEFKEIALTQVINEFGIGHFLEDYKKGGNVTTLHNANAKVFAELDVKERYEKKYSSEVRRKIYEPEWRQKKRQHLKQYSIPIDAYTNKELSNVSWSHLDHIVSAAEIHENPKARLYMTDVERGGIAVDNQNLALTTGKINLSKGKKDLEEWGDSNNSLNQKKSNFDYFEIDKKSALSRHTVAKKHINDSIKVAGIKYYSKGLTVTGVKQGLVVGLKQAMGLFLYELQSVLFRELNVYFAKIKHFNNWERRTKELKKAFNRVHIHMSQKIKRFLTVFAEGFLRGFISNLITVLINSAYTTTKNMAKMITDGLSGLWQAYCLLTNRYEVTPRHTALKKASKIITAILVTTTGVIFTESFAVYLKTTIFATFAELIGSLVGGILTGITVAILMYAIEELVFSLQKINEDIACVKKELQVDDKELQRTYTKTLATINHEYQNLLNRIINEYKVYRSLTVKTFDDSHTVNSRFTTSIELANSLKVKDAKILKNLEDVSNFFNL